MEANRMSKLLFTRVTVQPRYTLTLVLFFFLSTLSHAAQVTLTWDANDPAPDGYCIYQRTEGQAYDYNQPCWSGYVTIGTVDGLEENAAYYFVVRAFVGVQESADSIEVKFVNGNTSPIWIEAEDANLKSPMEIGDDAAASAGGYVWAPSGTGNYTSPSEYAGSAEYHFQVPETGEYVIWGRQISTDTTGDSFFVSVDDQAAMVWYTNIGGGGGWTWDVVSFRADDDPRDASNPQRYWLEEGSHFLTIKQREDGTKLDTIVITNDLTLGVSGLCVNLTGDANGDGVVNFADLAQLRADFGKIGAPGWIPADVNLDGSVNFADLAILRSQFGQTECGNP
jgi:hypothetical protein